MIKSNFFSIFVMNLRKVTYIHIFCTIARRMCCRNVMWCSTWHHVRAWRCLPHTVHLYTLLYTPRCTVYRPLLRCAGANRPFLVGELLTEFWQFLWRGRVDEVWHLSWVTRQGSLAAQGSLNRRWSGRRFPKEMDINWTKQSRG